MRLLTWTLLAAIVGLGIWLLLRPGDDTRTDDDGAAATQPGAADPALEGTGREPAEPNATSEPPAASALQDPIHASGTVIDGQGRVVAGASVVAHLGTDELARLTTGDDGTFRFLVGERPVESRWGNLRVRVGERGADRMLFVYPYSASELRFGRIVVRTLRAARVRVTSAGRPIAGAVVVGVDGDDRSGRTVYGPATTDAEGIARVTGFAASTARLFAHAKGHGRGQLTVSLDTDAVRDLELPADRTVTIHVKRSDTGDHVPNADVFLWNRGAAPFPSGPGCLPPLPALRTDESGSVTVSGLPADAIGVQARAEGLTMTSNGIQPQHVFVREGEIEGTVTLHPFRTIRFPIDPEGEIVPADGTELTVAKYQPIAGFDAPRVTSRVEDGHVVIEPFTPGFDVGHVVAPDGSWASWQAKMDSDLGEPVRFRRVYEVAVRLLWKDGTPAVGERLWLILRPRGRRALRHADEDGMVRFGRCHAKSVHVMWTGRDDGFGMSVLDLDLGSDPGVPEVRLGRPIDIAVRVLTRGAPELPSDAVVYVPDISPNVPPGGRSRSVQGSELVRDIERSELRFRWLPMPEGGAPPVTVKCDGYPPVEVTPLEGADGVWRGEVNLLPSATLRVQVKRQEGMRYWLRVQRWHEASGRWIGTHDEAANRTGRREVDGYHTYVGFPAGRYRILEHYTNALTEPFELVAGGDAMDVVVDLTSTSVVRGTITVPEGESPAYAAVRVTGRQSGSGSEMNPARVKADGTFSLQAPAGKELELRVDHPTLQQRDGPLTIVAGNESPVIQLVPRPLLRFQVKDSGFTTPDPDPGSTARVHGPVRVRLARGVMGIPQAIQRFAMAKNGRFRIGVKKPGTYAVMIEQFGRVPVLLRDVVIGAEGRDLGVVELGIGGTLIVRLIKGEQPIPERLSVQLAHKGDPPYTAGGWQKTPGDPPTIEVKGLGAGTFALKVQQMMVKKAPLHEREIELDGKSTVTIDVQLP